MKTFDYTIKDKLGIHARPAGLLVKFVSKFKSEVIIKSGDKKAEGKRLFALLGLGVKQNDKITVSVEGKDEEVAANKIEEFFKENF